MRSSSLAALGLFALFGCGEAPQVDAEPPIAVATPAAAQPGASPSARLTVLFTNNIDGEIEPCG